MRNNIRLSHLICGATVAIAGLAVSQPASATPSTLGFYPSTDIYGKGTFHLDVDSYGRGLKTDASTSVGLTYGFGPEKEGLFGRTEVGADYLLSLGGASPNLFGASGTDRLTFNAKTQIFNNAESGTRLVAGVWGFGNKIVFAPNIGYIAGSKSFKFGRLTAGVAHSFAKDATVATPAGNADRTNLHLAYDKAINSKLSFAVDYYSGKSGYSGVQPTLYYAVNDKASFGLGVMRFNDSSVGPSRNQVYACFDYNFGGSPATAEPAAAPAAP